MRKTKTSTKKNSSKIKYVYQNNNVIFEVSKYFPEFDLKNTFKIINDPHKPLFEMEVKKRWQIAQWFLILVL